MEIDQVWAQRVGDVLVEPPLLEVVSERRFAYLNHVGMRLAWRVAKSTPGDLHQMADARRRIRDDGRVEQGIIKALSNELAGRDQDATRPSGELVEEVVRTPRGARTFAMHVRDVVRGER